MSCTTVLIGKRASNDNSTMISRTDDGHFDVKKTIVVEPSKQPRKYKSKISHLEIQLPDDPMRYTACPSVDDKHGIWAATGINAAGVGMSATETLTSNARVLSADPLVELQPAKGRKKEVPGGIGEEDIVVLVLPYINSAREGVLRLASLLEEYGTYEMNGIAFNDENEIWWMDTIGGHHWIATKVPDDRVVINPNQFSTDSFDFDDAFGKQTLRERGSSDAILLRSHTAGKALMQNILRRARLSHGRWCRTERSRSKMYSTCSRGISRAHLTIRTENTRSDSAESTAR